MKNLYIQCNMGAAGDMLTAALLELIDNPRQFIEEMNGIGIPGVRFNVDKTVKCGVTGSHVNVFINDEIESDGHGHLHHGHCHTSLNDIFKIIDSLKVTPRVQNDAKEIYKIIADAESMVHNQKVTDVHFHEVGTFDAIADIVAVCSLIEKLGPDKIICSNICVGNGTVKCAHGILPVPAPATALILKGIPFYSGDINSELCTPTGAAVLKYFVNEYGNMPPMTVDRVGYGMGTKDFQIANCVRAFLGSSVENEQEQIVELCCNIDDMTGEAIGFATETLLESGALDVYTIPVTMKKSRPGIILGCLCKVSDRKKFINLIFRHTSTIGIRQYLCNRAVLRRSMQEVETKFGAVTVKKSCGYGIERTKPEFEDIRNIARKNNLSIDDVLKNLKSGNI